MQSATALLAGNLPAEPNSFIGRERDLAELAKLLIEVRALTLSGPGGIGKTRLAVRLARDVIVARPNGDGTEAASTEPTWTRRGWSSWPTGADRPPSAWRRPSACARSRAYRWRRRWPRRCAPGTCC